MKPLCFVLMPFGKKPDPTGLPQIDFDRIYNESIRPAIAAAGMLAIRGDEERSGGIIHKAMFERLLLCEYAVADLTTANANVFYELGVRHTARPRSTVALFARHQPIPFDLSYVRALPYSLGAENGFTETDASNLRTMLTEHLLELRQLALEGPAIDSPLFQLLGDWRPGEIARSKTDLFRERVEIASQYKDRLATARRCHDLEDMQRLQAELDPLDLDEASVTIDLLLSYRALGAWTAMIELQAVMPEALKRQVLVREQLAFALNRRAGDEHRPEDRERALEILDALEADRGPSSETCGLIGRIYKDRWDASRQDDPRVAEVQLNRAIDAYTRGFRADARDAYPGVNAVTLLDVRGDPTSLRQRDRLVPVVRFAVEQRLAGRAPDYWDHATMLELSVLGSARDEANARLGECLAAVREAWEPGTTARNLRLISEYRAARGEDVAWIDAIVGELQARGAKLSAPPSRD